MIQFRKATLSDLPEMMALFEMGIQSLKKTGLTSMAKWLWSHS